jgi:hypothetical protein
VSWSSLLFNNDYKAFISLSTDLRGEGTKLERLMYLLGMLRSEILVCLVILLCARFIYFVILWYASKGELQVIQDAIQEKLKKCTVLQEEKVTTCVHSPIVFLPTFMCH